MLIHAGRNEHAPHGDGPSSLNSMSVPLEVKRNSAVSFVHTASGNKHVPAEIVLNCGMVMTQSTYAVLPEI